MATFMNHEAQNKAKKIKKEGQVKSLQDFTNDPNAEDIFKLLKQQANKDKRETNLQTELRINEYVAPRSNPRWTATQMVKVIRQHEWVREDVEKIIQKEQQHSMAQSISIHFPWLSASIHLDDEYAVRKLNALRINFIQELTLEEFYVLFAEESTLQEYLKEIGASELNYDEKQKSTYITKQMKSNYEEIEPKINVHLLGYLFEAFIQSYNGYRTTRGKESKKQWQMAYYFRKMFTNAWLQSFKLPKVSESDYEYYAERGTLTDYFNDLSNVEGLYFDEYSERLFSLREEDYVYHFGARKTKEQQEQEEAERERVRLERQEVKRKMREQIKAQYQTKESENN